MSGALVLWQPNDENESNHLGCPHMLRSRGGGLCFHGSYSAFGICRQPSCCCYYWLRSMRPVNEMFISLIIVHRPAAHPHRSPPPFQLVFPWTASQSSHALPGPRPQIAVGGRADPTAKLAIVTLRRMHRHTENVGENWEKAVGWRETGEEGIFHCFSQLPHLLLLSWTNCVDSHWKHPLFTPLSLLRGLETRNN